MLLDICLDRVENILKIELELLSEDKFSQNLPGQIQQLFKKVESLKGSILKHINYILENLKIYEQSSIDEKREIISSLLKEIWKIQYLFLVKQYIKPPKLSEINWDMKVKYIKGVGPKKEIYLNRLGIFTLRDLISYFPRDYEDLRNPSKIRDLYEGQRAMIYGEIKDFRKKVSKGYRIYEAIISDGTGTLVATWFNQDYLKTILKKDYTAYFYGTVKRFRSYWTMNSPTFNQNQEEAVGIFPIYHLTQGITHRYMRRIMKNAFDSYFDFIEDFLPEEIITKRYILPKNVAIKNIHFPKNLAILNRARKTLSYEEMFLFQLSAMKYKILKEGKKGIAKKFSGKYVKNYLSFNDIILTPSQEEVLSEIEDDMRSEIAMNRLVQGDVGCGKTLIAELAILNNYEAGYQAAFLAPTVILAKQHYENIKKHFEPFGIKIELIFGGQTKKQKTLIKSELKKGNIDLIIGTHALIQEDVYFNNLGLVIVDEQHKFGVEQRASIISKNELADIVVMTATPIPRTLSMSIFGEIDISTIKDMPFGPKKIKTIILSPSKRKDLYEFLHNKLSEGKKVFFVYPLVEDSDSLNLRSATKMYEDLSMEFSNFSVELIHGKMKDEEKIEATRKFKNGECNVLVATTVIEVGIDISDADIIVIEHAERFGLSQLHQLRGRVGRKGQEAYCILLPTEKPTQSLVFFKNNLDGFKIADYDLKVRGPGEFMGVRQHGFKQFKMVDLTEDLNIIKTAQKDAYDLLKQDPELLKHKKLKEEFERKYGKALFYAKIG